MDEILGRVVAVAGSQMTATLEVDERTEDAIRIGAMVKARSADLEVVGTIAATQVESSGPSPRSVFVVDLLGEVVRAGEGRLQFSRGVSHYPISGTPVRAATETDLTAVYTRPSVSNVTIGTLYHDPLRPAFVLVNELLAKNFAVIGATGSGKSCAVTLILSAILAEHPKCTHRPLGPAQRICHGLRRPFRSRQRRQSATAVLAAGFRRGRRGASPRWHRTGAGSSGDHLEGCDNPGTPAVRNRRFRCGIGYRRYT